MRDRFSTAIYCDFCGKGKDEVARMIAAPGPANSHICGGCVLSFAKDDEIGHLAAEALAVQTAISNLARKARTSKDQKLTTVASDLYYASNRAWEEINRVTRGPLATALKERPDGR